MQNNTKIYDVHVHLNTDDSIAEEVCADELKPDDPSSAINYMEKYSIDKMILFPSDRILSPPRDFDFFKANKKVAKFVEKHPNKIGGAARINPLFEDEKVKEHLEYFLGEKKFKGIKLVARADNYRPCDIALMKPVMEKAKKYDATILFLSGHPSRDLPSLQAYLAKNYPNVKFVLAHMGLHDYLWEAIIACKENPNIFVDMSQAWPYDLKIFLKEVGSGRVMYGTDSPFQSPPVEQLKVKEAVDNKKDLENIFHKTAEKVWGI